MHVCLEVIGCQEADGLLATWVELFEHTINDVVWFFKAKQKLFTSMTWKLWIDLFLAPFDEIKIT